MAFHPTLSKSGRIIFWPLIKFTEFMGNHFPETLLKIRYRYVFKKPLNLKDPQDLNEKILIEFAKRNIEIPFSQLDVNLYNDGNKKLGKIKTSDITEDMITPHKSEVSEEKPVYEIDKVLKEAKKKITSKKKTTAKNKSEKK